MTIVSSKVDLLTSKAEILLPDTSGLDLTDDSLWSWQELIASTASDWGGFQVNIGYEGTQDRTGVVKIALGASGSEAELVKLPARIVSRTGPAKIFFPIPVPSGSRVSAAMAMDSSSGGERQVQVIGYPVADIGAAPFSAVDIGPFRGIGFGSFGRGVTVTADATANTKGAWTEITQNEAQNTISGNSLPHNYSHLGIIFISEGTALEYQFLIDVAIGASGSETIIAENLHLVETDASGGNPDLPTVTWIPAGSIGSGERISARIQSSFGGASIGILLAGAR